MNKFTKTAVAAGVVALGLAAGSAQAAFINGGISFTDFGLTVPGVPSTSITNLMTTITQGSPAVGGCTGNFTTAAPACDLAGALSAGTFNTGGPFGGVCPIVAVAPILPWIGRSPRTFS